MPEEEPSSSLRGELLDKLGKLKPAFGLAYAPATFKLSNDKTSVVQDLPGRVRVTVGLTAPLGPLIAEVQGAGLEIPLEGDDRKPRGTLAGIGLSYKSGMDQFAGPLELGGALLFNPFAMAKGEIRLDGILQLVLPCAAVSLAGSYGKFSPSDETTMFVFGELGFGGQLGQGLGPPCFQVTRLMGGYGYNSEVRLPSIDQVAKFPLLQGLNSEAVVGGKDPTPLDVLAALSGTDDPWVKPKAGNSWGAFGAEANVFELIDLALLGLVEWGNGGFSIAVLGDVKAGLPRKSKEPTAMLAGQLAGQYVTKELADKSSETVWSIAAVFDKSSFLVDKDFKPTGGLAFMMWTGGPHKGDSVFTAGGYSPNYTKPEHFPTIPRFGISFSYRSLMTIRGETYFAVVPRAIMLGGSWSLVGDYHWLRWWINVYVDAWISWSPWQGGFEAGVSVGLEADASIGPIRIRPRVEIGVDLGMWFTDHGWGGDWAVHVWFVSFSGAWGIGQPAENRKVGWDKVQHQIPASSLIPRTGLGSDVTLKSFKQHGGDDIPLPMGTGDEHSAGEPWQAEQSGFRFTATGGAPATSVTVNGHPVDVGKPATVHIRPMGRSNVSSPLSVTISHLEGEVPGKRADVSAWQFVPVRSNGPAALWGSPSDTLPKMTDDLVRGQITGLELAVPPPVARCAATTDNTPVRAAASALDKETVDVDAGHPSGALPLSASASPSGSPATAATKAGTTVALIAAEIAATGTAAARTRLFKALSDAGLSPSTDGPMTTYAAAAQHTLTDDPLLVPHG
ncbi:hypothetical protein H8N00_07600 [Streptomyces sp. AC563]|uniref:DUF6603 domain-containing protein n=1 Tax=Streptomyces buecherae TaxID=2763006 RepID=UPI00164E5000|nr:DUF6603 domain-containing protein [Streptomyces buecherae]MBC3988753.1 hypothetical protein [Streptomyces buecherae]